MGDDYTDCSFIFLYILCTMSIREVRGRGSAGGVVRGGASLGEWSGEGHNWAYTSSRVSVFYAERPEVAWI